MAPSGKRSRWSQRTPRQPGFSATVAPTDPEVFFAGVVQMRGYLDRHIQDPERRRARLARVAQELLRPRAAAELGEWLTQQLQESLGAGACTILLSQTGWTPWRTAGTSGRLPSAEQLEVLANGVLQTGPGQEDMLVRICGLDGPLGALWIESAQPLGDASCALLCALAGTAGIALDQALRIEALTRDVLTGLLSEAAFIEKVRPRISAAGRSDAAVIIVAFRVGGIEAIEEAHGLRAAQAAVNHLARAAEEILPSDTILGARFEEIFAACGPLRDAAADLARVVREIDKAVRRRAGAAGAALSVAAAYVVVEAPADAAAVVAAAARGVAEATSGAAVKVGIQV